jgi:PelA/Pel-15E family pectate lyase
VRRGVGRGASSMVGRRSIVAAFLAFAIAWSPVDAQTTPHAPRPTLEAELLTDARIDSLPEPKRTAWRRYLTRSRELEAADRAFMAAELRRVGAAEMRKATYARGFELTRAMTDAWFASDSARGLGLALLTWQTPAGGWSKRTEMSRPRQPGESWYAESNGWHYIGTIDNGATTSQLRFLARLVAAHSPAGSGQADAGFQAAYVRGLEYLLEAQLPNGCWPQVYPLQGGYSDAATFNDDAIVNVLELLGDVSASRAPFVPASLRDRAAAAERRGIDCVLAAQVMRGGVRTVWGQQHDPITLAPIAARSYELAGLSGRESAAIMTYLMSIPAPERRVVDAVHAAAAWFRSHAIRDYEYDAQQRFVPTPGAGPIWARLTDLETDRPIFANRDGVKLYDWNLLTDRRSGYAWFGTEPAGALRRYERWARAHPPAPRPRVEKSPASSRR